MSDANRDDNIERGRQWLTAVLRLMGLETAVAENDDMLEIDAAGLNELQKEQILGEGGVTLDALQYLANTLLNLHLSKAEQQAYTIELDGYRQHRREQLLQMTEVAVRQVRETQVEYEMEPLSAAERRQVHVHLQTEAYTDIETFSRGKEPHRRLVIRPADGDSAAPSASSSED
ncbi:MAG: R3H domain-containing nucleic acid-binding protein [Cyanobacteria bacterium P01_D01_bin.123]